MVLFETCMDFSQEDLWNTIHDLGWDVRHDNIVIEVGGTVVSGIHQGEDYNKKWRNRHSGLEIH